MKDINNEKVIKANIELHSRLADEYSTCEPHFRNENIEFVKSRLIPLIQEIKATSMLDLGCGTGFVINIAKNYLSEITGVDVTQAMLDKVDKSGSCKISLFNCDTGIFKSDMAFDLVTAYSFLHHLYDIKPTIQTAYNLLKPGGYFYADLDPNFYYWDSINKLSRNGKYSDLIRREIEMVTYKDEDIETHFGISKDTFNKAEFGKNIKGGFKEEELIEVLNAAGFREVKILYYWYLGQSYLVNNSKYGDKESRIINGLHFDEILKLSMPLSRHLYKYLGIIAKK